MIINYYKNLLNKVLNKYIYNLSVMNYSLVIYFNKNFIYNLIYFLKKSTLFRLNYLNDIIVYDLPKDFYRFNIIYILTSVSYNNRIILKTKTNNLIPIQSLTTLYLNAKWIEREIFDMFGISFLKNNDLRPLLTDYGFKGYPLRKDFPLSGFVDLIYDDISKKIKCNKLIYIQQYNNYVFNINW